MTMLSDPVAETIYAECQSFWSPPADITGTEWANKYRVLSPEATAEHGKMRTARAPYQEEILDCATDPTVREIVIYGSSQIGKTEIPLTIVGYFMAEDPCPMMYVMPILDLGKAWSKDRLAPMCRDTPRLKGLVHERKRESGNEILHKQFPGGHITIAGANSPASLVSRPIRVVFLDEVDKYGLRGGLTGIEVKEKVHKRTNTFWNSLIISVSSPETKALSTIEPLYDQTDKRRFHVPCIHCNFMQVLNFRDHLKYQNDCPETARYQCCECEEYMTTSDKPQILSGGKWIAEKPFTGKAGFWINEMYSPWVSWEQIVENWLRAQKSARQLKIFINESLAETWVEKGDVPDWKQLYDRAQLYPRGIIPSGGILLVAGVDIQKDRAEIEIVTYGANKVSWSVDYQIIYGNPLGPELWRELDHVLEKDYRHAHGPILKIDCLAIDSGYAQTEVLDWARKQSRRQVMAIKGYANQISFVGNPKRVDRTARGKILKRGVLLWPLGVSRIKEELYRWLNQDSPKDGEPDPMGYCHFPKYTTDYFHMLTAEEMVQTTSKGFTKFHWEKVRVRNEGLDCRVYARSAAYRIGMDRWTPEKWQVEAERRGLKLIGGSEPEPPTQQTESPQKENKPERANKKRKSKVIRSKYLSR